MLMGGVNEGMRLWKERMVPELDCALFPHRNSSMWRHLCLLRGHRSVSTTL